jgi:hypothetical protein
MAILDAEKRTDVKYVIALFDKNKEVQVGSVFPSMKVEADTLYDMLTAKGLQVELREIQPKLDAATLSL